MAHLIISYIIIGNGNIIMLNSCQAQRDFIKQSIINNIRVDGRRSTARRIPVIKTQVISHLPGSSYVYIEYENVQIYTGIKLKVEEVSQALHSNPVLLQLTAMRKLTGQQTEELERVKCLINQVFISKLAVSTQLQQFLHIADSKKHQLILNVDVFLLTPPHMSHLQLIITAIKSALEATKIPEIVVAYNQVTDEQSVEVRPNCRKLMKNNWVQILIVGMSQDGENIHFVIDMKREQFQAMDACFLLILEGQKVKSLESIKGRASIDTINRCVKFAMTCSR